MRFLLATVWIGLVFLAAIVGFFFDVPNINLDLANVGFSFGEGFSGLLGYNSLGQSFLLLIFKGATVSVTIILVTIFVAIIFSGIFLVTYSLCIKYFPKILVLVTVVLEFLLGFPLIVLAMFLAIFFGSSFWVVVFSVGLRASFEIALILRRNIDSIVMGSNFRSLNFFGFSWLHMFVHHNLRPIRGTIFTQFSLTAGLVVLAESSLTFLGFGVPLHQISWGKILVDTQKVFVAYPFQMVPIVFVIVMTVLCFSILAEYFSTQNIGSSRNSWFSYKKNIGSNPVVQTKLVNKNSVKDSSFDKSWADAVFRFENFSLNISGKPILKNISFKILPGEKVALIGKSGAGKSQLLKAMTGTSLVHLGESGHEFSGEVFWENKAVSVSENLLDVLGDRVQFVHQNPKLFFGEHASLFASFWFKFSNKFRANKVEVFKKIVSFGNALGLKNSDLLLKRKVFEVSGGQLQRLQLASILVSKPELILADEPVSALDPDNSVKVLECLSDLDSAVMVVAHDILDLDGYVDRVLVLDSGSIVEDSLWQDFVDNPKSDAGFELLSAANFLRKRGNQFESVVSGAFDGVSVKEAAEPVLRVTNFSAQNTVIKNYSFSLNKGEVVAFVGESGVGKSTLLNYLVSNCGHDSAVIFQDIYGSLSPYHSVRWQLREVIERKMFVSNFDFGTYVNQVWGGVFGDDFYSVEPDFESFLVELLVFFGLEASVLDRNVGVLSGGQRQRVSLCRAFLFEPEVLFLDEPFSALDLSVRVKIFDLFEVLRGKFNFSAVLVSHDMYSVARLADRVIILGGSE